MTDDTSQSGPLELESARAVFEPKCDNRPKMVPPPPVRLVAVEDVTLTAPAGTEPQLDRFYVNLLQFERERTDEEAIIYRGDNHRLHLRIQEAPIRRSALRPIALIVPSLAELEQKLIDAEIDYTRQRGLVPGEESLVLLDPAGNWLELTEAPEVR